MIGIIKGQSLIIEMCLFRKSVFFNKSEQYLPTSFLSEVIAQSVEWLLPEQLVQVSNPGIGKFAFVLSETMCIVTGHGLDACAGDSVAKHQHSAFKLTIYQGVHITYFKYLRELS